MGAASGHGGPKGVEGVLVLHDGAPGNRCACARAGQPLATMQGQYGAWALPCPGRPAPGMRLAVGRAPLPAASGAHEMDHP